MLEIYIEKVEGLKKDGTTPYSFDRYWLRDSNNTNIRLELKCPYDDLAKQGFLFVINSLNELQKKGK